MKKIKRCIPILLLCAFLVSTTSYASVKASEQISSYFIYAAHTGGGKIGIEFSITATNIMKEVGARNIYIYKMGTYGYELVKTYDRDDSGMTATNSWEYGNTIYYPGETGADYQVVVVVFAEDKEGGSDSRSRTFSIST